MPTRRPAAVGEPAMSAPVSVPAAAAPALGSCARRPWHDGTFTVQRYILPGYTELWFLRVICSKQVSLL